MEDFSRMRLAIPTPAEDDDAGVQYQVIADARSTANMETEFLRLMEGADTATKPAATAAEKASPTGNPEFDALMAPEAKDGAAAVTAPAGASATPDATPAAETGDDGLGMVPGLTGMASSLAKLLIGVSKDGAKGLTEAPAQAVGGVIDAVGEIDQAMQELVPIGGMSLMNEKGEFDPSIASHDQMVIAEKAGKDLFSMVAPDKADTITGGFVRSTAQFLTAFLPASRAVAGLKTMRGGFVMAETAAGAFADMVAFDPDEDRLSTWLNQVPALAGIVPDYLADTSNENGATWENRLKNAIEGAGLGLFTGGLLGTFKYYKAQRTAKALETNTDPVGAAVEASKDALKASAREELVQDVPDEALRGLGDTNAPLLIEAPENETAKDAFTRLDAARVRAAKADKDLAALNQVNAIREKFAAKAQAVGRDPMDEMLDSLRSNAPLNAKMPKRPVAEIVKGLGGVDPNSSLAGDLRSRGITAKAFPGLFRKGGKDALDNIPTSEHDIFAARNLQSDDGYIPQQAFIDGLEAELKGDAWRTPENQQVFDDLISPLDDLEQHLDSLGINYSNMGNQAIKDRLVQIADEEAAFKLSQEITPDGAAPRTADDMAAEDAQRYGESAAPKQGIFEILNSADPATAARDMAENARLRDANVLEDTLGTELAQEWRKASNMAGSSTRSQAEAGSAKLDEIEKGLTPEQLKALDGDETDEGADWWRGVAGAIEDHSSLSADELGENLRSAATNLPKTSKPWEKMTSKERLAAIAVNTVGRDASRFGVDLKELMKGAFEKTQGRHADPADAEFMAKDMMERVGAFVKGEGMPKAIAAPVVKAQQKNKIYINTARVNSAEDVRELLQQMVDLDAKNITDKTRGVVSNDQTIKESSQEYRDINDLIGRAPGPMTAAKAVAARRLLASSGEQLIQLAKKAEGPGATPADLYNFRRSMAVHYAIQSEVVAARTETARALQAWSIPAGATKARSQAIAELIQQGGGADGIQTTAKLIAGMADNPVGINTIVKEEGRAKFGKALYQVWINGLLSSPKTHVANMLSNSAVALWSVPERYMAAGVSKAFYAGEVDAGEATSLAFGLMKGIRDGIRVAWLGKQAAEKADLADVAGAFVRNEAEHPNAISAEAFGLDPAGGFGWGIDMMSKIINVPGSALGKEDEFFKTIGYRMELNAQAHRIASSEGLTGQAHAKRMADVLANPPENIKAEALDRAHYNTFTNALGAGARQALGGIAKTPYLGTAFKVVMPFVKTPTNILKYTFARTPLAYMSGAIKADIKAGGARAAQAHARVALGSMLMATVYDMTSEGTFTGRGPEDPQQRALWLKNNQPYSVRFNGRFYAYNRMDPIGMMIGLGADTAELMANAHQDDSEQLLTGVVTALANNLSSKTYLNGVFSFMAAADPNNPMSSMGDYIANQAGGLVPYSSFLRNAQSAIDPLQRDAREVVYEDGGEGMEVDDVAGYLQTMIQKIKKGIPGLSDELPLMRDIWGEEITKASGIGWAWDAVSPIASRADDPDPAIQVMIDNKIEVSFPPRMINGVKLTAEQYSDFSEDAGKMAKESVFDLINSAGFDKLSDGPDGMKAEMIKDRINSSREYAKGLLERKYPELRERAYFAQRERFKSLTGN